MTNQIRAALERLLATIEQDRQSQHDCMTLLAMADPVGEAIDAARAVLAQPEPEGPTDEELLSIDQLRDAWNAQADAANGWDELGVDEIVWWAQRQALARFGRPAPQPVAEVRQLPERDNTGLLPMIISETGRGDEPERERIICSSISGGADYVNDMPRELSLKRIIAGRNECVGGWKAGTTSIFARYIQTSWEVAEASPSEPEPSAADLLERQHPQPIPVSERLPGPGDCDAEGRCWWGRAESDDWSADWTLATYESIAEFCEFTPRTVWLPAHALPLPLPTPNPQP